jgi:5-methyltetrahydropteroyltriglutamate--homocysteine methyltransferase
MRIAEFSSVISTRQRRRGCAQGRDGMERSVPPFRADHIGSFVRPPALIDARLAFMAGKLEKAKLDSLEDDAIRDIVAMQEDAGLNVITDGEFRRVSYLAEFLNPLGIFFHAGKSPDLLYFSDGGRTEPGTLATVTSKIVWKRSPNVDAFRYLNALTKKTPKVTIPAPTQVHFFAGTIGIHKNIYPEVELFWDDIVAAYASELKALSEAGCRYVQIDETSIPKLADPQIQALCARRGIEWRALLKMYIDVMNRILATTPAGMTGAIHHCKGNNAGRWQAQASYDDVAEEMFATMKASAYLLEFDTPRAGDFAPLRFMPKDKIALLGLVSTKAPQIESADELKRRIDDAARYMPLDNLCLGPQCGFSCGFARSPMTAEIQQAKLRRIVEVARDVWQV